MSLNVSFYGIKGSYCEQALYEYFPNDVVPYSNEKFEDVLKKLEDNNMQYGILPIENSSTGAISEIYDLLNHYPFYIVGEVLLKVKHYLLGTKNSSLKTIKKVYSHPQPFEQSKLFLNNYDWDLVPYYSTARSAAYVKELNDPTIGAISSKKAADLYDLKILAQNINSNNTNTTRFVVLSKDFNINSYCNKISVVISTKHQAGALYKVLEYFAKYNINLLKIESRPVVHTPWEYYFYLDFEGNIENNSIKEVLNQMKKDCVYFKLLGNYKGANL